MSRLSKVISIAVLLLGSFDSHAQLPEQFVESLRRLRNNWNGCHAVVESVLVNPEREYFGPIKTQYWINSDGNVVRKHEQSSYKLNNDVRFNDIWKYRTDGFIFNYVRTWLNDGEKNKIAITANMEGKEEPMEGESVFMPAINLFGLDNTSGKYWYEIVADPETAVSFESSDGILVLSAKSKLYGKFEFQFVDGPEQTLRKVFIKKSKNEFNKSNYQYESYELELSGIEYSEINGLRYISKIRKQKMSYITESDRKKVTTIPPESSHTLIDLTKLNEQLTDQIVLPDVELADGTEVKVFNDKGIPYEIRNGYLVKQ